tara:strand:+ start:694 stop:945 length:252 start_codon:yes stop_codon:yes gene_type:complete
MFGLSVETMFALTLIFQGLILAFLFLNIQVFGKALDMIDCIHDMVHGLEEFGEAVEEALIEELSTIKKQQEEEEIQKNLEDWT